MIGKEYTQRDLRAFLRTASEAAVNAGELLKKNANRILRVRFKGKINLVTEMDLRSEQLIIKYLTRYYSDFSILAEEKASVDRGSDFKWIIDPLDGTTNYAHGFPFWCVSIALECKGEIIVGAVYDPNLDELFTAASGIQARMNNKPIKVTATRKLSKSLLATGFPYDVRTSSENNLNHFCSFQLSSQAVRRAGSAALDLCYLATGRFDGFWELKLYPWDTAAAVLIVKQAGGKVSDFSGDGHSIYGKQTLASNGKIHRQMIDILAGGGVRSD